MSKGNEQNDSSRRKRGKSPPTRASAKRSDRKALREKLRRTIVTDEVKRIVEKVNWCSGVGGRTGLAGAVNELLAVPNVVDAVCEMIRHGSPIEQRNAIGALHHLHVDPSMKFALLDWALKEGDAPVKAALSLGECGLRSVPLLIESAKSSDPTRRLAGLRGLEVWAARDDELLALLVETLSDQDETVRVTALDTLRKLAFRQHAVPGRLLRAIQVETNDENLSAADDALFYALANGSPMQHGLRSADERVRKAAAQHFPQTITLDKRSVAPLSEVAINDPSGEVRLAALLALEEIGLHAAEGLANVMAALEQAEQSHSHAEVRTRSLLVQERVRDTLARTVSVPRTSLRITSPARRGKASRKTTGLIAPGNGVLALLNALLEWGDAPISQRRLRRSEALKEERRKLGLEPELSAGTVQNYLTMLARMCGVPSILETGGKRQRSWFRPGVVEKLHTISIQLVPFVKAGEERERAAAQREHPNRKP